MSDNEAIGAEIMRACKELPEGWTLRIDLENGNGDVEISGPNGEALGLDYESELFSDRIKTHIDYAIEFVKESP